MALPFLKLGSFFSDPFTVTIKGCKLSYILPFSCEIKMISGRNQRISVRKRIFKKKITKIFFHFRNIHFRPKNSDQETQI